MPIIDCSDYKPSRLFRNGHFATIYPAFFRKQERVKFSRERVKTPDEDFLDVDLLRKKSNNKAVFLFHGLEGSTDSQYIQSAAREMHQMGFDIIATNFRGCSGEQNLKVNTYHSGFTDDVSFIIDYYSAKYSKTGIIAYSLGGNVALKYAGEYPEKVHPKLTKLVAVSVPLHLADGSKELEKPSNYFYTQNFLKTLKKKVIEKEKRFPGQLDLSHLKKVKSIWDFDEYYTGPINGFTGAKDYYSKSMALQFLPNISVETHIISSLDDPFLSKSCYPFAEARISKTISFHQSKYGGHVGFYQKGPKYWLDRKLIDIFQDFDTVNR